VLAAEAAIDHGDAERAEQCARAAEAVQVEIEAGARRGRRASDLRAAGLRSMLVRAAARFEARRAARGVPDRVCGR
jgi:hypothetical protein